MYVYLHVCVLCVCVCVCVYVCVCARRDGGGALLHNQAGGEGLGIITE